jgi:hypothetical protein
MKLEILLEATVEDIFKKHFIKMLKDIEWNVDAADKLLIGTYKLGTYLNAVDDAMNGMLNYLLKTEGGLMKITKDNLEAFKKHYGTKLIKWWAFISHLDVYLRDTEIYVLIYKDIPLICFGEMGRNSFVSTTHKAVFKYDEGIVSVNGIALKGIQYISSNQRL